MAFKMKGPSMQAGTTAHRSALKEIGNTLDMMNRSKKASPAKVDETTDNEEKNKKQLERQKKKEERQKKREKRKGDREERKKARKEYKKTLKSVKKIKKDSDKQVNEKRKENKRIQKAKDLESKRNKKISDTLMDVDKPGTMLSRTAKKTGKKIKEGVKKVGEKITKGVKNVKEGIKRRKEEKQYTLRGQIKSEENAEKRLELRKERRSRIADNLEYIFLDGKRPEEAAYRRKHGYYRDDDDNKLDTEKNNANEKITPSDDDVETKYTSLQSKDKVWDYRYDPKTNTYQTKKKDSDDWITPVPNSKADKSIREKYPQ